MSKFNTLNVGTVVCLTASICIMYHVLLYDEIIPLSIRSMQLSLNHCARHWHFIAVGLLPVYVALVFFGASIAGFFFGKVVQRWIGSYFSNNK